MMCCFEHECKIKELNNMFCSHLKNFWQKRIISAAILRVFLLSFVGILLLLILIILGMLSLYKTGHLPTPMVCKEVTEMTGWSYSPPDPSGSMAFDGVPSFSSHQECHSIFEKQFWNEKNSVKNFISSFWDKQ